MSHRPFSCCNISSICFSVFYFTHGCPPLYSSSHGCCSSFPKFAYEIKSHLRRTMSTSLFILPPLLGRYYWESRAHQFGPQMTFSSWPNPDKLSVLLKKSPLSSRERKKGWARDKKKEREREESQKANVSVTPFLTQQGKFLFYNRFWLIWSQLERY